MRLINVNKVTSSMTLAKPIFSGDRILLNVGINDLGKYAPKLEELGVHYLYVDDEISAEIEIDDVIADETRIQSKKIVHSVMNDIKVKQDINIGAIKSIVMDLVDNILCNKSILLNLTDIRTNDSYTFSHSVNVAVLSLVIGRVMNYDQKRLFELGTGALLHDIGKALIPTEILNKPGKLTDEEFAIMQQHPQLGYDILKNYFEMSAVSRAVVLGHHEKINGSGYPRHIDHEGIHEFARIVSIADVYDALTSDRCYRPRWPVYQALEYLMANISTQFDKEIVGTFIRNVAVFPTGTTVTLSNGMRGIIVAQNEHLPTRPMVKLIEDSRGEPLPKYKVIDLMKELSIVIISSD